MKLTPEQKAERRRFRSEHAHCWMCKFLRCRTDILAELHHIAGRGRKHDVRANYASLCQRCHGVLQSTKDAEVVCLVLKRAYDNDHYDPALICDLRSWSATYIDDFDVKRCERIMNMMREVAL